MVPPRRSRPAWSPVCHATADTYGWRMDATDLPRIGAPATRALHGAGVHTLADVRRVGVDELSRLHGVGPTALRRLEEALEAETGH
ncbi:hypothetical protein DEJ35_06925 [Curtobacterium sp. MCPF17_051]|nr:hypothetical protein DEJ35_06925 [Curtobacterium sp. MCPF17_051]